MVKFNKMGFYWQRLGQFNGTLDIASDATGNVYVADAKNKSVQKFDDTGKFIAKFAF
jgi:tripartite motif-containing protein 71